MPKVDIETLIKEIADAQGREAADVRRELRQVERTLGRTTTVVAKRRTAKERAAKALESVAVDVTKSEFERNLQAQAEAEALRGDLPERCAKCGHKYAFCTCGGKVPWDCDKCIAGRGKGAPVGGRDKFNTMQHGDKLCAKHDAIGVPARNRAEKRRAIKATRQRGAPRRTPGRVITPAS